MLIDKELIKKVFREIYIFQHLFTSRSHPGSVFALERKEGLQGVDEIIEEGVEGKHWRDSSRSSLS